MLKCLETGFFFRNVWKNEQLMRFDVGDVLKHLSYWNLWHVRPAISMFVHVQNIAV